MEPVHERELVDRCRREEPGAFEELVDHFKHLVFALIARTIADRSRAEDVAQEVFLRVHRGLPYFRGEARLSTWIFRIVVNVCSHERTVDHARGAATQVSLDDPDSRLRAPSTVDRRFTDLELRDRLEKAIQQLPSQYRILIAGHYLQGLQYEDLADAMNLPLGTVKTQLHRAKRRLRELLEGELR
jgi:RNA polymerase sigma-70 factor (ECF subfamily)